MIYKFYLTKFFFHSFSKSIFRFYHFLHSQKLFKLRTVQKAFCLEANGENVVKNSKIKNRNSIGWDISRSTERKSKILFDSIP